MSTETLEIEVNGVSWELEVEFEPPGPYRWNEPPETGELSLPARIKMFGPEQVFEVPLTDLLDHIIVERGPGVWSMDGSERTKAEEWLEDRCFQMCMERMEEEYDDREE